MSPVAQSNERSSFETGEGFSPQTLTPCTETDPSSGGLRPPPSPTRGHKGGEGKRCPSIVIARSEATKQSMLQRARTDGLLRCARNDEYYSCPSSVSPPETSTLPGAGSRLSFLTTPSSTSIE